ncbi:YkgJ family cysteine cluster protein [Lysinibacillus capsici]|uniref:YkgJ family cysteine cluster protein n=1 Tax=Lysinibacillus capsici TaxID=2115968 RepID=UPI002DB7157A|nr:YkgJ family cysteine cluster protein [Lysinibacillus capsici]
MTSQFPCTKCGACCMSIDEIDFLEHYNENGVCINLIEGGCSIYTERPLLCRIDESYEAFFSSYMSKENFYLINAKACNELQEKLQINKKYRVWV